MVRSVAVRGLAVELSTTRAWPRRTTVNGPGRIQDTWKRLGYYFGIETTSIMLVQTGGGRRAGTGRPYRGHVTTLAPRAVLSSAARLAHRFAMQYALPGRLLVSSASRMYGMRVGMLFLMLYSLVVTTWAAYLEANTRNRRHHRRPNKGQGRMDGMGPLLSMGQKPSIAATRATTTAEYAQCGAAGTTTTTSSSGSTNPLLPLENGSNVAMSQGYRPHQKQTVVVPENLMKKDGMMPCPICGGTGVVTWESKFLHEDHPCPRCLGKRVVASA